MILRGGFILCVALGFFALGLETSHGAHALYEQWYCLTPLVVIGIATIVGAADFRRHGTA